MLVILEAILLGLVIGAILGIFVSRKALREHPVYGSVPARLFNYLIAVAVIAAPISGLSTIFIFHGGIVRAFIAVAVSLLLALIFAVFFAIIEQPALLARNIEDEAWTEEKARASRL